jgi:hypothetical protein
MEMYSEVRTIFANHGEDHGKVCAALQNASQNYMQREAAPSPEEEDGRGVATSHYGEVEPGSRPRLFFGAPTRFAAPFRRTFSLAGRHAAPHSAVS